MALKNDLPEETRKAQLAKAFFQGHLYLPGAIKNVDFCIASASDHSRWLFLAEAKRKTTPLSRMMTQLMLTLKRSGACSNTPRYLGCFDDARICFISSRIYQHAISEGIPDITPSDSHSKPFKAFEEHIKGKLYNPFYNAKLFDLKDTAVIKDFVDMNILGDDLW